VAELVLGSAPAATPVVVDGAARDRRLRQLAATQAAALAQPDHDTHAISCRTEPNNGSILLRIH